MRIGVLALQGAFREHREMLRRIGVESFEVRQCSDWVGHKDGLILPGGESTTQARLLHDSGLFELLRNDIMQGLPVFGTCAGMILLSSLHLATMPIDVLRNAYGRQLGSFRTVSDMDEVGRNVPMTFIRAPYISGVSSEDCIPLASVNGHVVAARQGRQLVTSFHPELDNDSRVHEYFIGLCRDTNRP